MKTSTIIKIIVVIILFSVTSIILTTMTVPFTNELAVNQLKNENVAFVEMTLFYKLKGLLYLVPTTLSLFLFKKDIKKITKKTREERGEK